MLLRILSLTLLLSLASCTISSEPVKPISNNKNAVGGSADLIATGSTPIGNTGTR